MPNYQIMQILIRSAWEVNFPGHTVTFFAVPGDVSFPIRSRFSPRAFRASKKHGVFVLFCLLGFYVALAVLGLALQTRLTSN